MYNDLLATRDCWKVGNKIKHDTIWEGKTGIGNTFFSLDFELYGGHVAETWAGRRICIVAFTLL